MKSFMWARETPFKILYAQLLLEESLDGSIGEPGKISGDAQPDTIFGQEVNEPLSVEPR